MRKIYRLKRDGQIVHTFRSTVTTLDGRQEHLTRAEVGRAGQEFTDLPRHVTDPIDAGELDELWEVVMVPEEDDEEEPVVTEPSSPPTPIAPVRGRRARSTASADEEDED